VQCLLSDHRTKRAFSYLLNIALGTLIGLISLYQEGALHGIFASPTGYELEGLCDTCTVTDSPISHLRILRKSQNTIPNTIY